MLREFGADGPPARLVGASPDGAFVAAEMVAGDLRVFDGATGERLWSTAFEGRDVIVDLAVQSDPFRLVALSFSNTLHVFDRSGDVTMTIEGDQGHEAYNMEFSTDGRTVAVNTFLIERQTEEDHRGRTVFYDLDTGEQVDELPIGGTADLAFSPDGLVAVARRGSGEVWSLDDQEPQSVFASNPGNVFDASFHPSGAELATASLDGSVRLWDPETGVQRVELSAHDFQLHSVEYSMDGSMLISADNNGLIRSWATEIDDLVALAEDEVARDFTDEECRQYLHVESCPAA
jgi:WD40 repeat protein